MTYLGHPAHRLTPRQQYVLLVLANRGECARNDWNAWYPLDVAQVYGLIDRLARRGLVDVAGFEYHRGREVRTFKITRTGLDAIEGIDEDEVLVDG